MDVDGEDRTKEEVNADGAHVYDDWKSIVVDADKPHRKTGEYESDHYLQEQDGGDSPILKQQSAKVKLGGKGKLAIIWSIYGVVVLIGVLVLLSFILTSGPISYGDTFMLIMLLSGIPAIGVVLVIVTVIIKVNENANKGIVKNETGEPISDNGVILAQNHKICDAMTIILAVVAIGAFVYGRGFWLTEEALTPIIYVAIAVPLIYLITLICKTKKGYKYSPALLFVIPALIAYPVLNILKEEMFVEDEVLKVASIAVFMSALILAILAGGMREKQKIPIVKAIVVPILIIATIVFIMMPYILHRI